MKNNIFLTPSSKKSNERFNFLELGNNDFKPKEKKHNSYPSSDNSFKQNKDIIKKNYSNRDSYDNPEKSRFSNHPKSKQFNILDEDFPILNLKNDTHVHNNDTKYRDIAATKELSDSDDPQNNIEPGFIEISSLSIRQPAKISVKYGPLTSYQFNLNKLNLKRELLSQDSNYCMNQSIIFMRNNWDKYRNDYDSVYGDGAYENMFVYKSDFEFDNENDNDSSPDIDSEIEFTDNNDFFTDDYSYRDY